MNKNAQYFYIYITINLVNGKKYIGKRTSIKQPSLDNYLGSGKFLKQAIKKYGIEIFEKEILETCLNTKHLNEREKFYIKYYNADKKNNDYYNIVPGGQGGFRGMSIAGRKSIAKNNSKRILSKETLYKLGNGNRGKNLSLSHRLKLGLCRKNKKDSKKTILKRSKSLLKYYSKNYSKLKDTKLSKMQRKNQSLAAKKRWRDFKNTA